MRHFLSLADHTPDELNDLIDLALDLKSAWREGGQ